MSASNGGLPGDITSTVFSVSTVSFPHHPNQKIRTIEFLEASKGVVIIVEQFGKAFAPVKYDMNGNITKITQKYNEDQAKHEYLEDMLLLEKQQGGLIAIDALQWLRRGLHFIVRFFQCIIEDNQSNEDLGPYLKIAYTETLERYHGWMGTQLFKILSRFAPTRRDLFFALALQKHNKDEHVLRDLRSFTNQLSACVFKLIDFYNEHDLETDSPSR